MRHVLAGRVVLEIPSTVVADGEALVTWIAPGTQIRYPHGLDSAGDLRPVEEWEVVQRPWHGNGALDVAPSGRAHMIRHFWNDDGSFRGWYVNLQAPLERGEACVVTTDHQLDLWIDPGGTAQWKDEHHLAQAVELGLFDQALAREVETEATRVVEEWPFPTGWENWRPDPSWPVPDVV